MPLNGYPWPASAIGIEEMGILYRWRKRTGTPINELLRQCIVEMDRIIKRAEEGQEVAA